MKFINKKNIYLLSLFVICLLMAIIVPTYAKFASNYVTTNDMVGFSLDFGVIISGIEEYEQVTVPAKSIYKFNVKISNASVTDMIYYGIWYRMIKPAEKTNDILIGMLKGSDVTTSGSIDVLDDTIVTIVVINNGGSKITLDIGVASSNTSTSDIEYLDGKYLVSDEVVIPRDITISSIKIDGVESDYMPTNGVYNMSYTCSKGSQLEWETLSKSIIYKSGSYVKDSCSLEFTTSTDYRYLYEMPVGSYVAYEGMGGVVGTENVVCKKNGSLSLSTATSDTESSNSCLGQNAREDLDDSGYTYGYCHDSNYKYYTTGWRIAYIDYINNKAVLVSAGSPECNSRTPSTANTNYIQKANALALKYCNTDYVDGNCTCIDTNGDGSCDTASTDAWAINDNDFYNITKAISGVGKRLASDSASLGDAGGTLGNTLFCYGNYSYRECGYNNDLIDNGGYYWFAARYTSTDTHGMLFYPDDRYIYSGSAGTYGLRPVVSLSSSVVVTGGRGTIDSPYLIQN